MKKGIIIFMARRIISIIFFVYLLLGSFMLMLIGSMITFLMPRKLKYFIWQKAVKLHFNIILLFGCLRIQVIGYKNIPKKGPAILYSNHPGFIDMFLLIAKLPRKVRAYMSADVLSAPLISRFFENAEFLPVNIKTDKPYLSAVSFYRARNLLRKGEAILTMPAIVGSTEDEVLSIEPGFFKLVGMANVPVIGIAIKGSMGFIARDGKSLFRLIDIGKKIMVNIGKPEDLASIVNNQGTAAAEKRVKEVIKQLYAEIS